MNIQHATALASLLATLLAGTARADGLYVEVGTFAHRYDLRVPGSTSGGAATGNVLAGALRLGWAVDERWAVEAGYMSLGSPGYSYRLGGRDGQLSTQGHAWLLAGRGTLPLDERFSLVARLGLSRNHSSVGGTGEAAGRASSGSATALYASAGLQMKLAPHWQLGLALEHLGMSRSPGGKVTNGVSTTLGYQF